MREGPGERWGEAAHSELSDDGRQNAVLVGGNASTTTACKTPTERPVKLLPSVKCEPLGSTGVHLGSVDLVEKAPRNCQIHAEDEPQVEAGLSSAAQCKANASAPQGGGLAYKRPFPLGALFLLQDCPHRSDSLKEAASSWCRSFSPMPSIHQSCIDICL